MRLKFKVIVILVAVLIVSSGAYYFFIYSHDGMADEDEDEDDDDDREVPIDLGDNKGDGFKIGTSDEDNYVNDSILGLGELPDSVMLRDDDELPPIGDQGTQNSCVGWVAGYYANTYAQAKERGWGDVSESEEYQMSPAWVYNMINGGSDAGSTYSRAMDLLMSVGNSDMYRMPYNSADYTSWGGEESWDVSYNYRISDYSYTTSHEIDVIKSWLDNESLPMFAIHASEYLNDENEDQVLTSDEVDGSLPNHANVIVGYDDDKVVDGDVGAFKAVNTWGENFYHYTDGDYWITYDAFLELYEHNVYVIDDVLYDDVDEPELTFDVELSERGDRDVDLSMNLNGDVIDYFWVKDSSNLLPDYMSFDLTDVRDEWYEDQWNSIFEFEMSDYVNEYSIIDDISMNYNAADDFVKTNITNINESNDDGITEDIDFVLMSDVDDIDPVIADVPDGEMRVVFEYAMNVNDVPEVELLDGDVDIEFDRWDSTFFDDDTAIFSYSGLDEHEEVKFRLDNFENILSWDAYTDDYFIVGEPVKPTIGDLTDSVPETGNDYNIEYEFDDVSGVDSTYIEWWSDVSEIENVSGDSIEIVVPENARYISYRGVASDIHGSWNVSDYVTTDVRDIIDPSVNLLNEEYVHYGDEYEFVAEADDNIELSRVLLRYEFVDDGIFTGVDFEEMKYTDDYYYANIRLPDEGYDIAAQVIAEDDSGNRNRTDLVMIESEWMETYRFLGYSGIDGFTIRHDGVRDDEVVDIEVDEESRMFGSDTRIITIDYHNITGLEKIGFNLSTDDFGIFGDYLMIAEFDVDRDILSSRDDLLLSDETDDVLWIDVEDLSIDRLIIYENPTLFTYLKEVISARFEISQYRSDDVGALYGIKVDRE